MDDIIKDEESYDNGEDHKNKYIRINKEGGKIQEFLLFAFHCALLERGWGADVYPSFPRCPPSCVHCERASVAMPDMTEGGQRQTEERERKTA